MTMSATDVEAMMTRVLSALMSQQNTHAAQMTENAATLTDKVIAKIQQKNEPMEKKEHDEAGKISEKSYKRLEKFVGGESFWNDWKGDFEMATRAINGTVGQTLKDAADSKLPFDVSVMDHKMQMRSKELYEVLYMMTSGEAKILIKSSTEDGFRAWQILDRTYSRRTLAKMLRLFREASNPPQATTLSEVVAKIGEWEGKIADLKKMRKKEFDPMLKLAALVEICTPELKDLVFQHVDDYLMDTDDQVEEAYLKVKEKIISLTSNRLSVSRHDCNVGHVGCQPHYDHQWFGGEDEWVETPPGFEAQEINLTCFTCGGEGHPQRLCPTPKGGGKGGGGKGYKGGGGGKGGYKGGGGGKGGYKGGYAPKGFGKGYQGTCFNCGQVGHKAAECRSGAAATTNLVETQAGGAEAPTTPAREIGGVSKIKTNWFMGNVDKVTQKPKTIQATNRYDLLSTLDEAQKGEELFMKESDIKPSARKETITRNQRKKVSFLEKQGEEEGNPQKDEKLKKQISEIGQPMWRRCVGANLVEKVIAPVGKEDVPPVCQMTFHITDANKMLASVTKMMTAGNNVHFAKQDSYVQSPSGRKAYMKEKNGIFVLEVVFFNGEQAVLGEVIVDSGAADHVIPKDSLADIPIRAPEEGVRFVAADGAEIGNYGRKDVQFIPAAFWEERFGSPFQGRA